MGPGTNRAGKSPNGLFFIDSEITRKNLQRKRPSGAQLGPKRAKIRGANKKSEKTSDPAVSGHFSYQLAEIFRLFFSCRQDLPIERAPRPQNMQKSPKIDQKMPQKIQKIS